MCSFLNNVFTVTSNNNTMNSIHRIGNRNVHSKLPIVVFQLTELAQLSQKNLGKPRLSGKIFCVMFCETEIFPMLHSALNFKKNVSVCRKGICKTKFHMVTQKWY